MQNKPVLYLVGTLCPPELEDKFNKWYDSTHVPLLLKSKWCNRVTRYKIAPVTEGDYPEYLAIYEFTDLQSYSEWRSSSEMEDARTEMADTWKEKTFDIKWRVIYEPLATWPA